MATWYVNTDDQSGGEYASLSLAEAALPATLGEPYVIECAGATEDGPMAFSVTTSAENDLTIVANGISNTGQWDTTLYRIVDPNFGDGYAIDQLPQHITFRDLQIGNSNTFASFNNRNIIALQVTDIVAVFDRCLIDGNVNGTGVSASKALYSYGDSGHDITIRNSILRNVANEGFRLHYPGSPGSVLLLHNSVIHSCGSNGVLISGSNGTVNAVNSVVFDTADDFSANLLNVSYCASDDGDGTNSVQPVDWSEEFEDYANGDLRLKAGSALIGAGTDLSADFTTDITGATRTIPWDIGAFEYSAGGGGGSINTDTAWRVFSRLARDSAWKILNGVNADTAWRIFNVADRDTAWKVQNAFERSTSWKLFNLSEVDAAWMIYNQLSRDSSWKLYNAEEQSTSWKVYRDAAVDTAWRILNAGSAAVETAWKIYNEASRDTAWSIANQAILDTAWQIFNAGSLAVDVAWKIANTTNIDSAWSIFNAASQDAAWKVFNFSDRDVAWRILGQIDLSSGWKIFNTADLQSAWAINSELVPEPVRVFVAETRMLAFSAEQRTLIFFDE